MLKNGYIQTFLSEPGYVQKWLIHTLLTFKAGKGKWYVLKLLTLREETAVLECLSGHQVAMIFVRYLKIFLDFDKHVIPSGSKCTHKKT